MTQAVEALIERRRRRRSLTVWRIGAIVLAVITILALFAAIAGRDSDLAIGKDHVARVEISGFIGSDRPMLELMKRLEKDNRVKAVILDIDSPGGAASAGEALYESIRKLADAKPVAAHIDAIGTSAAYMAAIASDHITARRSAITGSIGVVAQFGEASALLDKLGISVTELRSGTLKAVPSPFRPPEEAALDSLRVLLDDTYDWFVAIVVERRSINAAQVRGFQGRAFTGNQALKEGLIDALGGEEESRAWLAETHEVGLYLPMIKREPKRPDAQGSLGLSLRSLVGLAEAPDLAITPAAIRRMARETLALDGVLSVWQAPDTSASGQQTRIKGD